MKKLIFLLLVIVSFSIYADVSGDKNNGEDRQTIVETVTTKDGDKKRLIKTIGYYPGMEIEYISEKIDGKDEEKWTWYFPNGAIMLSGTRSSVGNIGEWIKYYANGKIQGKIYFNDLGEMMDNLYVSYYPNGQLAVEQTPTLMKRYDLNGNLETLKEYKFLSNGESVPNGKYEEYENGKLALKGRYVEGKEDGMWYWYDESGNMKYIGLFIKGVLENPEQINE